jgi:protein involved in polysaccharide export with SLBB domain
MKKRILINLFLIIIFSGVTLSQVTNNLFKQQEENKNFLENQAISDPKSLREYYQNVFRAKEESTQNLLMPSFEIDKNELLEKLRELIPQDSPVNPDKYLVGPGDFLQIGIWSELGIQVPPLQVSPEGIISIPNYGIMNVSGLTLTQVKELVKSKLQKEFIKGDITTTLYLPRIFAISVSGVVENPGTYYASAVQRVDQVIYLANLENKIASAAITQEQTREREKINRPDYIDYVDDKELLKTNLEMSLRNIKVIRQNNDTLIVDLARYYATGDYKYNPYLNEGDRVIVPNQDLPGNSLTIQGAVRLEGTYEYNYRDSLSTMMDLAQGPTAYADLENIELYRFNETEGSYSKFVIDYFTIQKDRSKDIKLKARDRVVVREKFPRNKPLSVVVKGEVVKPGLYPIVKDKTKLTDVIEMANGFTKDASLSESRIIRFPTNLDKTKNNPDYERLFNMRLGTMDEEDRQYFNLEYAIKRNFVSVDFKRLFIEEQVEQDITLEDGDVIIIPKKTNTIYVYGQIARPGYIDYVEGKDYEYYIEKAGGTTEMAKESEIAVVKAGTRNWVDPDDTKIEHGDIIYIPREKETNLEYYFTWFSQIVGVIAGVATVIILLRN